MRSFSSPAAEEGACTYCPFHPVCGDGAPRRARLALAEEEDGALARFRALALGEEEG